MVEVSVHDNLVLLMEAWVCSNLLADNPGSLRCDLPHRSTPPRIVNNIPDLYVAAHGHIPLVLGEAKTAVDVETRRSHQQIVTFLQYCDKVPQSVFILAVPWHRVPYAKNLLRQLCRQHGLRSVDTVVIKDLPG